MRASGLLLGVTALVLVLTLEAFAQMAVEFRIGGLDVGGSSESLAVKRYGNGLRIEQPDGGVTHVYEDPRAHVSLFIQCGQEGLVDEIQVMEGLARPYSRNLQSKISLAGLKTGAGLPLGVSRDRVEATYGEPQSETHIGKLLWLTYRSNFSHDRRVRLSYQMSFAFQGNRLVRILLHNG